MISTLISIRYWIVISIASGLTSWTFIAEVVPLLVLILLAYLLYKTISNRSCKGIWKYVIMGTILSYLLLAVHWASESSIRSLALVSNVIGRNCIPQLIYTIGFLYMPFVLKFFYILHGYNLSRVCSLGCILFSKSKFCPFMF